MKFAAVNLALVLLLAAAGAIAVGGARIHPRALQSSFQPCGKLTGSDPLALHNMYRAAHGAAALVWDDHLSASAQSWANKLAIDCSFYHSGGGENLASGFQSWADVLWAWYSEYQQYSYSAPGYSSATGHFTELLWAGTQRIGCAFSRPNCWQGIVWACHYDPVGNVNSAEYFRGNIFPPSAVCGSL